MANPHKGEVALDVDGNVYVLRFSMNSLCELEEHLDESFNAIALSLNDTESFSMRRMRAVLWAGLIDRQPGTTLAAAGEIAAAAGLQRTLEKVTEAFAAAFPAASGAPAVAGSEGAPAADPR